MSKRRIRERLGDLLDDVIALFTYSILPCAIFLWIVHLIASYHERHDPDGVVWVWRISACVMSGVVGAFFGRPIGYFVYGRCLAFRLIKPLPPLCPAHWRKQRYELFERIFGYPIGLLCAYLGYAYVSEYRFAGLVTVACVSVFHVMYWIWDMNSTSGYGG